jgi:hypothetical protein
VVGDHYDEGVLGIFIPDGAIIPDKLVDGIFSEGLFYGSRFWVVEWGEKVYNDGPSFSPSWKEGDDVSEAIGVTFHERAD